MRAAERRKVISVEISLPSLSVDDELQEYHVPLGYERIGVGPLLLDFLPAGRAKSPSLHSVIIARASLFQVEGFPLAHAEAAAPSRVVSLVNRSMLIGHCLCSF